MIEVNGAALYYTKEVTREEAQALGDHFVRRGLFTGQHHRVQLAREGGVYQVRIMVKPGTDSDEQYLALYRVAAFEIARDVFQGQPTEIHLCNEGFQTIRVVYPVGI